MPNQPSNYTTVCFRVTKGSDPEVTAVWPNVAWNRNGHIACYARIGQHGGCSVGWVKDQTRPATPKEYAPLLKELRSIGYTLRVIEHFRRKPAKSPSL